MNTTILTLEWHHNQRDDVSNHRRLECLFNRFLGRISKKTSTLRVTGLCEGNPPVTNRFSSQRASNAENISVWWRHHEPGHDRQQLASYQLETSEYLDIKMRTARLSVRAILFLLFINNISSFTLDGYAFSMFAHDVLICASAGDVELLKHKLETCVDTVLICNCRSITSKWSRVTIIESNFQLQFPRLDTFIISLDSDKLELVWKAKCLGSYVRKYQTWEEHKLNISKIMCYLINVLCRLHLCNDLIMHVDTHGYDTMSSENINSYVPRVTKKITREVLVTWLAN